MRKADFLGCAAVRSFSHWLAGQVPTIAVQLRIGKSRFVPAGLNADLEGLPKVAARYIWKAQGMQSGDWTETAARLAALSKSLEKAVVVNPDDARALDACREILAWGGDRDPKKGALPFLQEKRSQKSLCHYLRSTRAALSLNAADTQQLVPPVKSMNAMLTKVHALCASDGLPIYDSRVAAAIASLVEWWRRTSGALPGTLPEELDFPATASTRTVLRLFGDAPRPRVLSYTGAADVEEWTSAKVRLGWLIEEVVNKTADSWREVGSGVPQQMRAFEAALFMVGYDVHCLSTDCATATPVPGAYESSFLQLQNQVASAHGEQRLVCPLSGKGTDILFRGSLEAGYRVEWGGLRFTLEPTVIDDIHREFADCVQVALDARMNAIAKEGSLGRWLVDNGWPSPRYGSAIAAILRQDGLIKGVSRRGNALYLEFRQHRSDADELISAAERETGLSSPNRAQDTYAKVVRGDETPEHPPVFGNLVGWGEEPESWAIDIVTLKGMVRFESRSRISADVVAEVAAILRGDYGIVSNARYVGLRNGVLTVSEDER